MKKIDKNDPLLRYGGYASIMTAIFIIAAILVNMAVCSFNIKFDLTKNKLYTLSEDTISLLKGLDEDVNVYSVYQEGGEMTVVTEILDKYASYSEHVKVSNIDPYADPTFAARYGDDVTIGSVVVETKQGAKVIPYDQVMSVRYDEQSQTAYYTGVNIEGSLTGTIRKLTSGAGEYVYMLTGHGETAMSESLITELGYSNFETKTLDLLTANEVPSDCAVLVINGPVSDFSSAELNSISKFLENGGDAYISIAMTVADMPNFASLLANYGVADSRMVVIEGSADYALNNNPLYLLPTLNSEHPVTSKLVTAGTKVFVPAGEMVARLSTVRSTVKIDSLAATSPYAYAKDIQQLSTDATQTASDPHGQLDLAVAITDTDINGVEDGTRIIVVGSNAMFEDDMNGVVNGGNFGMVINAISWLTGSENTSVSKSIGADDYLNLTQSKALIIMFVCVILIPLCILIAGFVVFVKRRNR